MQNIKNLFKENEWELITEVIENGRKSENGTTVKWCTLAKKHNIRVDALKSMQDAYDKFTEDSLKKYGDLSTEVQDLKEKLTEVTSQLSVEKQNYTILREEHDKLKISYNNLKKDFDDYKKKYK